MKGFALDLNLEVWVLKHGNGLFFNRLFSIQLKSDLNLLLQIVLILTNTHTNGKTKGDLCNLPSLQFACRLVIEL